MVFAKKCIKKTLFVVIFAQNFTIHARLKLVDLLGNLGQVIFAGDGGGKFQNPKAGFFIVGLLLFKLLSLFSR